MHELEGILTIKDSQGNLTHVFYNDIKRKAQICYKVKECGAEDIKQMLDVIAEVNINPLQNLEKHKEEVEPIDGF